MAKSISKMISEKENLMVVDGLNLAFRWKHNGTKNWASRYLETINSLAMSYKAKHIVVLGDAGSVWRKKLSPEYKANRKELIKKQTLEEAQAFKEFLEEFDRMVELLSHQKNISFFKFKGIEADDIAGYIVKQYNLLYPHIWLISSDKDWDLLVSDKVSRFSYRTRKEIRIDNWDTHYDYKPEDHISIKVLMGDNGDNISGVAGVGEKRAYNLIKEYGSAYDIYDQIPLPTRYKYIINLNEFKENILLNYELMDILTYCDEILGKNTEIVDSVLFKAFNEQLWEALNEY